MNNGGEEYIAFRPEQIKSATDNTGTFDRENPDIRYSLKGTTITKSCDSLLRENDTPREHLQKDKAARKKKARPAPEAPLTEEQEGVK